MENANLGVLFRFQKRGQSDKTDAKENDIYGEIKKYTS